jgi:hypothetical protein
MKDFINDIQNWWRDTQATLNAVRANGQEVCEYSVREALETLGFDDWKSRMTQAQYAEQVLQAVLDEKFIRYLRACEPSVVGIQSEIEDVDIDELLNYSIKDLGCTQLMAAAGKWRQDRLDKPVSLFPKVLQALSGTPHVCSTCALTKTCQPEHACCRELLLAQIEKMGWNRAAPGVQVLYADLEM